MTRPGYKITEIGEIPEEWKVCKLVDEEISEIIKSGGTPLKSNDENWQGNIPFVTIGDMTKTTKYLERTSNNIILSAVRNSSTFLTPPGSLLLSMYGTIGKLSITKKEMAISQNIAAIIPNKSKSDINFIFYAINELSHQFSVTKTITLKHLDIKMVKNFKVPLPPLPEQQKIAEILTTAEDAIQKVNEQITLTEQLKKGLMQKLLTKGIGHTKFKKTEIGEIPEEWDVNKISDLKQSMYYGVTAKATEKDTNLRLLRTTDIENFKFNSENLPFCEITEKKSDLSKYYLKKDDVIVARAGTVGISVLVKDDLDNTLFGSYLIKIVFKHEKVDMKFIHYYFQSQLYWNNLSSAQGSTIKNINLPFLNSLVVPLPNVPEQQKIAKILNTADRKLELLRNKKEQAEHMKKGLMQSLLTGQVRVKINSIKGDN